MTPSSNIQCNHCGNRTRVLFCRSCTNFSCVECVEKKEIFEYYCKQCDSKPNGEICGICGEKAKESNKVKLDCCPECLQPQLEDPETVMKNLPSEFYTIISTVSDTLPDLAELYRSFEFFVTLVRLCRLAGLMGFPQIEVKLDKCANGLNKITEKGIDRLINIRKMALFDIRRSEYFRNLQIEHYKSIEGIINTVKHAIDQTNEFIIYWISEVESELKKLYSLADSLRQHYELLTEVNRFLPEGIYNVAAIVPPMSIEIKTGFRTQRLDGYIVFSEEYLIFVPDKLVKDKKNKDIINPLKYAYSSLNTPYKAASVVKGGLVILPMNNGEIRIISSPTAIDGLIDYFDLILSKTTFMVGSPKEIIEIENKIGDKNDFKRATSKFITIFRERLFGSHNESPPVRNFSIKDLKDQYFSLQKLSSELDFRAKNLQINPDEYRSYRKKINDNLRVIRDNYNSLGGHFTQNKNLRNWDEITDFNTI